MDTTSPSLLRVVTFRPLWNQMSGSRKPTQEPAIPEQPAHLVSLTGTGHKELRNPCWAGDTDPKSQQKQKEFCEFETHAGKVTQKPSHSRTRRNSVSLKSSLSRELSLSSELQASQDYMRPSHKRAPHFEQFPLCITVGCTQSWCHQGVGAVSAHADFLGKKV